MNLSLYTGGVKPYLEYGWVCAPNTAGQSIAANTITTLTIDTEVADTGNFGSIASNQITLAAGTYYFKARIPYVPTQGTYNGNTKAVFSLFNVSDSAYVTRVNKVWIYFSTNDLHIEMEGQFTIPSAKAFTLRIANNEGGLIGGAGNGAITLTGATDDQRTTLKLWKLA